MSLLGWVFSFTWDVILKLFFSLLFGLLAGLPYLLFEREYRHRLRLDERLENLQQRIVVILTFLHFPLVIQELYQSLQSSPTVLTGLDDRVMSYPIMAKETPANRGRLERSMQDIAGPVVPGPSNHSEPPVEIASPYHVEAHEENTSHTMERPSQQAAPHSLRHSDSETDASVALPSSTGAVDANTTTDVHPWFTFRNASSSSASTGGERRRGSGGDDRGEGGDDTHEREREWERELARRTRE